MRFDRSEAILEDLVEAITRGNVTEVKVVLASVTLALAAYQVFLMAVGYGKLRLRVLEQAAASATHRAVGDTIVVVAVIVAFMCLAYFGFDDDAGLHAVSGTVLLVVLALKVAVVRWWHGLGRYLPALGLSVFTLFTITWLSSAGDFLFGS